MGPILSWISYILPVSFQLWNSGRPEFEWLGQGGEDWQAEIQLLAHLKKKMDSILGGGEDGKVPEYV